MHSLWLCVIVSCKFATYLILHITSAEHILTQDEIQCGKKNNAIINIVARFQLQKRVYDIVFFLQIS